MKKIFKDFQNTNSALKWQFQFQIISYLIYNLKKTIHHDMTYYDQQHKCQQGDKDVWFLSVSYFRMQFKFVFSNYSSTEVFLNCKIPIFQFHILHVLKILNALIYTWCLTGWGFFPSLGNFSSQGCIVWGGVGVLVWAFVCLFCCCSFKDYTKLEALLRQ